MAEFIEVIKKKKEMCEYLKSCLDCPLGKDANITCEGYMFDEPIKAEELIMNWEPPVDWSKVEVDTPIYVRDYEDEEWRPRHFAKYVDNALYSWRGRTTSFTSEGETTKWNYAKLADKEA